MRKIKIGLDFDGVVAYNPFRVIRAPITYFKRHILKTNKLKFWIPKAPWEKLLFEIIHRSSVFPATGVDLLKKMANDPRYEFHLVTGRYNFLFSDLDKWLIKHDLKHVFKSINGNQDNQQPFLFKEQVIKKLQLDYLNLDLWQA